MKRRLKYNAALAAAVFMGVCGFALKAGAEAWYFIGGTGNGAPLTELANWNSIAGGGGNTPLSFNTADMWILDNLRTRVGNFDNDTFDPPLIIQGSAEIDALGWPSTKTYLTQVDIGSGQAMFTTGRDNASCGLGITTLNANGALVLLGNTSRPLTVYIDDLNGNGNIYAGDATTGREAATTYLCIVDASDFTGVVRFRNTTGGFVADTDLSSAQLFIHQADATDQVTTFDVSHAIKVKELKIHGTTYRAPATYTPAQLSKLATGLRISFTDNGGSITVVPFKVSE